MLEYYPWSKEVLNDCLDAHLQGSISTLDLDLSAKCTKVSCIYCDSKPEVGEKHRFELSCDEIKSLLAQANKMGLKWIYACGLGEPLEDDNFWFLLEESYRHNINVSLFTNGVLIDKSNAELLHKYKVNLIVKLDSLRSDTFDSILSSDGASNLIYYAIDYLLAAGYGRRSDNYTDIAVSIVPTKLNLNDIEDVIKFAKRNNIYPSVGELEQAGRVLVGNTNEVLGLEQSQIEKLKATVEKHLCIDYMRPVCPTIITGVHVTNTGDVIVDKDTGLNCKWFMLEKSETVTIGNVRLAKLNELFELVNDFRKNAFVKNIDIINEIEKVNYIFGGCGGSPNLIIKMAKEIYS